MVASKVGASQLAAAPLEPLDDPLEPAAPPEPVPPFAPLDPDPFAVPNSPGSASEPGHAASDIGRSKAIVQPTVELPSPRSARIPSRFLIPYMLHL